MIPCSSEFHRLILPSPPPPRPSVFWNYVSSLLFSAFFLLHTTVDTSYLAGIFLAISYSLCLFSGSSLGSGPVFSLRARPVLSGTGDAGWRGGGSLPPFWNPSPSSVLTGLGPEPLLRFGELT